MVSFTKSALATILSLSALSTVSAAGCGMNVGRARGHSSSESKRPVDISDLPPGCDKGATVQVSTSRGRKMFKAKPNAAASGFYGESDDGSSIQYIRGANDAVFGSIVDLDDNTVSSIQVDADGNQFVTVTNSDDFPPEGDPEDRRLLAEVDAEAESAVSTVATTIDTKLRGSRKLVDDGSVMDVLVLYTPKAECRNSGLAAGCTRTATTTANMKSRIELAISETNTDVASGVQTSLRAAHPDVAVFYDYVESSFSDSLYHIRTQGNASGTTINSLRAQYNADFVALIIDDPQYCGLAYLGPDKNYMYSVTKWSCATGYYSFGHEIGHNMGLNHDRGTSGACSDANTYYGYRDPQARFRSVLAYNCNSGQCDNNPGGGCTRVNRYSGTASFWNGNPAGNASNDNVKQINSVRVAVSQYFNSGPTPPNTNAPTRAPTASPTSSPTRTPTPAPTEPTPSPTTASPTKAPTPATPAPTTNCTTLRTRQTCKAFPYCSWGGGRFKSCSFSNPAPSPVTEPTAEPPVGGPTPSECAAFGESCVEAGDCCNGQCSRGKKSTRVCLS